MRLSTDAAISVAELTAFLPPTGKRLYQSFSRVDIIRMATVTAELNVLRTEDFVIELLTSCKPKTLL